MTGIGGVVTVGEPADRWRGLIGTRRNRLLAVAVVVLLVPAAGCSGTDADEGGGPAPIVVSSDPFASGVPSPSATQSSIPPAPGTLPAAALASIPLVVMAHNALASYATAADVPPDLLAAQARDAVGSLRSAAEDLSNDYGRDGRELANLLTKYAALTAAVAEPGVGPTPDQIDELAELDKNWRQALDEIGSDTEADLTSSIPDLLVPLPASPGGSQ